MKYRIGISFLISSFLATVCYASTWNISYSPTIGQQVATKTLDSEIDRLSIKYRLASSTIRAVAKCESSMYGGATHINSNGSKDWGLLQVNSIHIPDMLRLGLDITDPFDSLEYGFILMKTQGLRPWSASLQCWSKLL